MHSSRRAHDVDLSCPAVARGLVNEFSAAGCDRINKLRAIRRRRVNEFGTGCSFRVNELSAARRDRIDKLRPAVNDNGFRIGVQRRRGQVGPQAADHQNTYQEYLRVQFHEYNLLVSYVCSGAEPPAVPVCHAPYRSPLLASTHR
jgi:hypothetical protein